MLLRGRNTDTNLLERPGWRSTLLAHRGRCSTQSLRQHTKPVGAELAREEVGTVSEDLQTRIIAFAGKVDRHPGRSNNYQLIPDIDLPTPIRTLAESKAAAPYRTASLGSG